VGLQKLIEVDSRKPKKDILDGGLDFRKKSAIIINRNEKACSEISVDKKFLDDLSKIIGEAVNGEIRHLRGIVKK